MTISVILFYVFAATILISAIMMVTQKNLVHSALFMVATFIGVAAIYLLLSADFLAAVQILVYVGAISVLFIFGVMLTRRGDISKSNLFNKNIVSAGVVSLALFGIVTYFVLSSNWKSVQSGASKGTITQIADLLFNNYIVAFEISGLLLLVALIGSIIIGKGENNLK